MDADTLISSIKFGGLSGKHKPPGTSSKTRLTIQQDVRVSYMAVPQGSCAHPNIRLCIHSRMGFISVSGARHSGVRVKTSIHA